jgi:hypothetical protein
MNELTEADLEAQFSVEFQELAARKAPIRLLLTPLDMWILLSQIQLACRHPENTGPSREHAERIARQFQEIVAFKGALRIVAERGWDAQYDVPQEGGLICRQLSNSRLSLKQSHAVSAASFSHSR